MTLYKVIDTIKMLSLKHPNVNSACEGNIYDIMNGNPQHKYATIVLTQDTHTEDEVFDNYNLNIFYVDRLFSDIETNRLDIQSTAKNVLSNIIRAFCEEFDAECNSINYHTFTERFVDECAGAYAAITISIPKDIYCTEKYWDGNWSAPSIKIVNQNKKVEFTSNGVYVIDYDSTLYTGLGKVEVEVNVETDGSYEEGYNDGFDKGIDKGIEEQKSKLESITINENGTYTKEDGYDEIIVNVIDTNGSYEDGYLDGETDGYSDGLVDGIADGIEQQKSKLETITITENGTYTKEDGYNSIIVDVEGSGSVTKIDVNSEGIRFGRSDFENLPEYFDFSNVTDFNYMFENCSDLKSIHQLDTSSAIEMLYTFYNCINLETIPLIDTSNVTTMQRMFYGCSKLTTIPLLDTSNTTDFHSLFYNCSNLTSIPQLNTSSGTDMRYMFYSCKNLKTIPLIDTSNVTTMGMMFHSCSNLTSIPQLDTSNITNYSQMFYNCNRLQSLPSFNVGKITRSIEMNNFFGTTTISSLTDFGGFIDLKFSLNDNYFLKLLPNLTYESCINVLNGLYDFTGNGETPTSSQGKLKVHANFLTTVGDEISIGTNKGWTITA